MNRASRNPASLYPLKRAASAASTSTTAVAPGGDELPRPSEDDAVAAVQLLRAICATRGLAAAIEVTSSTVATTLGVDRVHVLFRDGRTDALWTLASGAPGERRDSPARGLAGCAVEDSRTVCTNHACADARYDRETDDPEGLGTERLACAPIRDALGRARGALVAVRLPHRPPFEPRDEAALGLLAATAGPALVEPAEEHARLERAATETPYRIEAIAYHASARRVDGEPIRVSPAWAERVFVLTVALFALFLAACPFVRVPEYAGGPAKIVFADKSDVVGVEAGVVARVLVQPGDTVETGQALVELHRAEEEATLTRFQHEFDSELATVLREPSNQAARQSLASLRAERDAAEARLERRTVVAPRAGIISGLRVRAGQRIGAGDVLLSLLGERDVFVVAQVPGRYRAELAPGLPLRFELSGYEHVYEHLTVANVSEVMTAEEAAHYLGEDSSPSATTSDGGPVVLVWARLDHPSYTVDGATYAYHERMPGRAEARVRTVPLLVMLMPSLRLLTHRGH